MRSRWVSFGVATFCFVRLLAAFPQGFQPVDGSVSAPTIEPNNVFLMESSGRAIVNWESFSINADEFVYFAQSGDQPALLNRVVGNLQSQILGRFKSNGAIYLLNPNGIFIGPKGDIQTAGFTASTFDVSDQAFMDNDPITFSGNSTNSILNTGSIFCQTGDILVVSTDSENQGTMDAPNGTVTLISGQPSITVKRVKGSRHFYIQSNSFANAPQDATTISMQDGQVHLQ
jgi:filamentous hemagglutinin family protein